MNIKKLYVTAVVGIALLSGWNVSRNMSEKALLSDMALANVEALAGEDASGCSNYCISDSAYDCYVYFSNGAVLYCPDMKSKYT
jgi:hypothetical protein